MLNLYKANFIRDISQRYNVKYPNQSEKASISLENARIGIRDST